METVLVPIDSIKIDPRNPRRHTAENLQAIGECLLEFGLVEPLVIQAGTNRLIAGHGRLIKLRELGETEVAVVEVKCDDARAKALAIAMNRTGDLSVFDDPELLTQVDEIEAAGLKAIGFSDEDLQLRRENSSLEDEIAAAFGESEEEPDEDGADRGAGAKKDRMIKVSPVFYVEQAETLERAIRATGEANRGKALVEIAEFYLQLGGGAA